VRSKTTNLALTLAGAVKWKIANYANRKKVTWPDCGFESATFEKNHDELESAMFCLVACLPCWHTSAFRR
jgi:hypothetical protein